MYNFIKQFLLNFCLIEIIGIHTNHPQVVDAFSNSNHITAKTRTKSSDEKFQSLYSTNASPSIADVGSDVVDDVFESFCEFLEKMQKDIIFQIESHPSNVDKVKFCSDAWTNSETSSRGLTRVIQPTSNQDCFIEKGAVSTTYLENGVLSSERAKAIQGRRAKLSPEDDGFTPNEGDIYKAAALSLVLHTRSPMVPTFRSDVRMFVVKSNETGKSMAWFGGGADLTPYYLFDEDVSGFHSMYKELCNDNFHDDGVTYYDMKSMCDEYFYIPARKEHRGTGGIFWDDMLATPESYSFTKGVAKTWMPSWLGIVSKRNIIPYTDQQRQWQLLRRGRYLEFNLLYDRGVRFGLVSPNPRVEGIMVSAPPLIAWEYNHKIDEGSEEEKLMTILKNPKQWA